MGIKYFDIHSHLESSKFNKDREEIISRMQERQVFTITVGTDLENSKRAVGIADKYDNIFASIGLHPTDTDEDFNEEDYADLVKNPKVVAIGECGLERRGINVRRTQNNAEDDENFNETNEGKRQIDIFKKQIDFAVKYDKPLMIHCRDAHQEVLEILREKRQEYGNKVRGNIHFFSGGVELAKKYIELGFTVSFTGVITFSNDYDDVIKEIPLDKIMSETDSPFVAPVPHRGQRCEPIYVKEVVMRIAEIKDLDEEEVKKVMVDNAKREFGIK